jgi:predicted nucleotidyltransferase
MDRFPEINELATRHAAGRAAWLTRSTRLLRDDPRVAAALLAGSLGRGGGDDWSDIDLVVVFRDGAGPRQGDHEAFPRDFGDAVVVFDSPWNAPRDGAQVNALYDIGGLWPLYVDWDLWPRHHGGIAADVRVLFDDVGLPAFPGALDAFRTWERGGRPAPTEVFRARARLAMFPIVAKCLVRRDDERARRMLANLLARDVGTGTRALLDAFTDLRASIDADARVRRMFDQVHACVMRARG